jgi:hypothetical protein
MLWPPDSKRPVQEASALSVRDYRVVADARSISTADPDDIAS